MDALKNAALFYFIKPRDTISRQRGYNKLVAIINKTPNYTNFKIPPHHSKTPYLHRYASTITSLVKYFEPYLNALQHCSNHSDHREAARNTARLKSCFAFAPNKTATYKTNVRFRPNSIARSKSHIAFVLYNTAACKMNMSFEAAAPVYCKSHVDQASRKLVKPLFYHTKTPATIVIPLRHFKYLHHNSRGFSKAQSVSKKLLL